MIRDYKLRIVFQEGEQITLEFEGLHSDLKREFGTVWNRYTVGPLTVWEFSSYRPKRDVEKRMRELMPRGPKWFLLSENRLPYGSVTPREIDLLLDATGFGGRG